jgi:hypothetical protein
MPGLVPGIHEFWTFGRNDRRGWPGRAGHDEESAAALGERLMRYPVVIEKANGNYSAYVPDLNGCVATGKSVAAVEQEIRRDPLPYRRAES